MKKTFMRLILTLFLFATFGNVFAEEMEKAGTGSGSGFSSGIWKGYPLDEETQFVTWEQKGVSLSDDPKSPFHNMSQNCAGLQLWNKGIGTTFGYCIGLAPDGDKTLVEVKQENMKPGLQKTSPANTSKIAYSVSNPAPSATRKLRKCTADNTPPCCTFS